MEPLPDRRETEVLGDKVFRYNMPVEVLYSALTDGRPAWLRLQPGEVEPQVVEAVPWERVVWSSFWPVSPDDIIELVLSPGDARKMARLYGVTGSALRVRWLSNSPPDNRGIGVTRWRLSRKFGGDLRAMESDVPGMYEWLDRHAGARRNVAGSPDVKVRRVIKVQWHDAPDDQN